MQNSLELDFSKYKRTIQQIYNQRFTKRIIIYSIALIIALAIVFIAKIRFAMLLFPIILYYIVKNIQSLKKFEEYFVWNQQRWQELMTDIDWESPENTVYEESNGYLVRVNEEQQKMSKKGSRTFPSDIHGISLLVGENDNFFEDNLPVLLIYCDTTGIKYANLDKQNVAFLKQWKMTKLKNQLRQPLTWIGVVFLVIVLYLLGGI